MMELGEFGVRMAVRGATHLFDMDLMTMTLYFGLVWVVGRTRRLGLEG